MVRSRFLYVPIDGVGRYMSSGTPSAADPDEPGPSSGRLPRTRRPETTTDTTGRPEDPDRSDQPRIRVGWRLIGANNRELGRSPAAYASLRECRAAVGRLKEGVEQLRVGFQISGTTMTWTWRLELDGQEVATSGRPYQRQREAHHNVALFVAAVPLAEVNEVMPNRPRLRGLRPPRRAQEGPGPAGAGRAAAEGGAAGLLAASHLGRPRP